MASGRRRGAARRELRELLLDALALQPSRDGVKPPPGFERLQGERPPHDAAVLVPIIVDDDAPRVLLTLRTDHLEIHAGQVSFPGGRTEPGDRDSVATALREAEEEIGLSPVMVDVLGTLGSYRTITNYLVTPVIGLVKPGFVARPDSFEVAEVFEVPLATLRDPAQRKRRTLEASGATLSYWAYDYEGRLVWGATAAILVDLCERLDRCDDA